MAENLLHFGAVRLRVTGTGNLQMKFKSMDDVRVYPILALPLTTNGREPARLCNVLEQRSRLEVKTTKINESFRINRIVVFVKPTYTSYPM